MKFITFFYSLLGKKTAEERDKVWDRSNFNNWSQNSSSLFSSNKGEKIEKEGRDPSKQRGWDIRSDLKERINFLFLFAS